MSVLSNVDVEKEILAGNIRIFPFDHSNIKSSSYNLTASKYAWSLKTKEKIVKDKKIIIPPHDTGIIATKEVIWVSKKICGTYHSKVSVVSKGGGHIGTTLDSEWIGHSIIAIHNHTKDDIVIDINDTFISIMFHYLHKPTTVEQHNSASQYSLLSNLVNLTDDDEKYFDESWKNQSKEVLKKVKSEKDFIALSAKNKNPYISTGKVVFYTIFGLIILSSLYFQTQLNKESFLYTVATWTTGVGFSGVLVPIIHSIYTNLK
ncbi:dCTP deaminase domain-containing protein [Priestia megaterium]|uniref:dCTP deaminase domain-containing protein n=1 Tax=Priestia megaterium TaxID=1404 RepID=UPI001BEC6037|nr:hypothetical protein [Priestia megaterium]MBT2254812.1 hypothetical protein [Priestia megaterium]